MPSLPMNGPLIICMWGALAAFCLRPLNNAYELTRPILAEHSSYAVLGSMASRRAQYPKLRLTKTPSGGLKMFDEVVSAANRDGLCGVCFFWLSWLGGRGGTQWG